MLCGARSSTCTVLDCANGILLREREPPNIFTGFSEGGSQIDWRGPVFSRLWIVGGVAGKRSTDFATGPMAGDSGISVS